MCISYVCRIGLVKVINLFCGNIDFTSNGGRWSNSIPIVSNLGVEVVLVRRIFNIFHVSYILTGK